MPDPVGTIAEFAVELIKLLNPSELERVKKEIRKKEEELKKLKEAQERRRERLKQALADGDIVTVNAILDE